MSASTTTHVAATAPCSIDDKHRSHGHSLAELITYWTGSQQAFWLAAGSIVIWLLLGPFTRYSDTWQLTINTGTSIITFLMVFLIQRTQNRDTRAMHLKLNELIAAAEGASNRLINAEDLDDETMYKLYHRFQTLAHTFSEHGEMSRAGSVEEVPTDENNPAGVEHHDVTVGS